MIDHMELVQPADHALLGSRELDAAAIVAFEMANSPYIADLIPDNDASRDLNYLTQKGLACTALKEWLNHRTLLPYKVIEDSFARKREDAVRELIESTSHTDQLAADWSFIDRQGVNSQESNTLIVEDAEELALSKEAALHPVTAVALAAVAAELTGDQLIGAKETTMNRLGKNLKFRFTALKKLNFEDAILGEKIDHDKAKRIGHVAVTAALVGISLVGVKVGFDAWTAKNSNKHELVKGDSDSTASSNTVTTIVTNSSSPTTTPSSSIKPPAGGGAQGTTPDQPTKPIDRLPSKPSSVTRGQEWSWNVANRVNPRDPNIALEKGMAEYSLKTGQPTRLMPRNGTMWIMVGNPGLGGHIITPQEMEYLNSLIDNQ